MNSLEDTLWLGDSYLYIYFRAGSYRDMGPFVRVNEGLITEIVTARDVPTNTHLGIKNIKLNINLLRVIIIFFLGLSNVRPSVSQKLATQVYSDTMCMIH